MLVKCMWMLFVLDIMGEMAFVTLALLFVFFFGIAKARDFGRNRTFLWHTQVDAY